MIKKSFQLRYACGCYWIIKISAYPAKYHAPIITNETGCAIWNCLQQDYTVVETAQALAALYKIPYEEALQDTNAFIQLLKQNGCIETTAVKDPAASSGTSNLISHNGQGF